MPRVDAHGVRFRGVYGGPDGAKPETKSYKSRKRAVIEHGVHTQC
jgi:hypothetical protein